MSSFEFYFDDDEVVHRRSLCRVYRNIREKANPLSLSENEFVKIYRLNKAAFLFLYEKFDTKTRPARRSSSLSSMVKLLSVLKFLAVGAYQKCIGTDYLIGMERTTFSKTLVEVLNFFEKYINKEFIKFDTSEESLIATKMGFYEKNSFPGIIGVVDGTHVKILSPAKNVRHLYYNRKGYYSINVMLVCDNSRRITYVDARHAGATHDSLIWNVSALDSFLSNNYRRGSTNSWIIGDCGYPLKPYLLTPYKSLQNNDPNFIQKQKFNYIHSKCRNIIERVNGILKNRFRVILGSRQLNYHPDKVTKIINAVCALHNICRKFQVPEDQVEIIDELIDDADSSENFSEIDDNDGAKQIRDRVMLSLN